MNCAQIEELLPRYVEDDVSEDERRAVAAHVSDCSACAQALAEYERIEAMLLARHELLPSSRELGKAVVQRLGIGRRPWWTLLWPVPLPAAASAAMVTIGIVMLVFHNAVARWLGGALPEERTTLGLGEALGALTQSVMAFAGANQVVVTVLYFGVFGLIFLTGSLIVVKFVRD